MRKFKGSAIALALVAAVALIAAGCGSSKSSSSSGGSAASSGSGSSNSSSSSNSGKPIVIGAAIDFSALMAPTDDPALYGAEIEANKINSQGGVNGRKIKFDIANTQLKPAQTRSDALNLVQKGANIL